MNAARVGSWVNATIVLFALTACCILVVIVTSHTANRIDMTATRQHALSPRTTQVLRTLDKPMTLVVAADLGTLDRSTKQRTLDVLDRFENASSKLKVRLIDTTRPDGVADFDRLLRDLSVKDRPQIEAASRAIDDACSRADTLAESTRKYQEQYARLRELPGANKNFLDTKAAIYRVLAEELGKGTRAARELLKQPDAVLPLPPIDLARNQLTKPIGDLANETSQMHQMLQDAQASAKLNDQEKAISTAMLAGLPEIRDSAARLSGDIQSLNLPRLLRVARALQARRAAILIDETSTSGTGIGLTAIDVDALLATGSTNTDLRARTEDLITGAVVTMSSNVRPVVCVVHSAPIRLAAQGFSVMTRAKEQLSMHGIELIEWAVMLDRDLPAAAASRDPKRPVVFVTITAEGKAQDRATSIPAFTSALNQLIASGRNVLLSVNLSQTPMNGGSDPLTECLKPLGVVVDSGRPLLEESKVTSRRIVSPYLEVIDPLATHELAQAFKGLRLRLPWALNIDAANAAPGVAAKPLITVQSSPARWAESEWLEYYSGVSQAQGDYSRIANPPSRDTSRDNSGSATGWTVATAIEKTVSGLPTQRVVVVGSNGWFLDLFTAQQAEVDGRAVAVYPGNLQLFESAVHWLAFQDEQIVRGATAAQGSTIRPLSPGELGWLRVLLVGILPGLVLVCGLLYRVSRR